MVKMWGLGGAQISPYEALKALFRCYLGSPSMKMYEYLGLVSSFARNVKLALLELVQDMRWFQREPQEKQSSS